MKKKKIYIIVGCKQMSIISSQVKREVECVGEGEKEGRDGEKKWEEGERGS